MFIQVSDLYLNSENVKWISYENGKMQISLCGGTRQEIEIVENKYLLFCNAFENEMECVRLENKIFVKNKISYFSVSGDFVTDWFFQDGTQQKFENIELEKVLEQI